MLGGRAVSYEAGHGFDDGQTGNWRTGNGEDRMEGTEDIFCMRPFRFMTPSFWAHYPFLLLPHVLPTSGGESGSLPFYISLFPQLEVRMRSFSTCWVRVAYTIGQDGGKEEDIFLEDEGNWQQ